MSQVILSLFAALFLASIHVGANRLAFLTAIPRSKWLSFAGGSAVTYIFLHLFPELHEWQERVLESREGTWFIKHPLYLIALLGLAVFYGLERMVRVKKGEEDGETVETKEKTEAFWLHISSFAVYNAIIGYLLLHRREEEDLITLSMFVLAMAFHFLVNDFGLLTEHQKHYLHQGRWIVGGAVLLGWGISYLVELPDMVISGLFSFIAGGVVLNVLKEELPEERKSNFWAFFAGVVFYAVVLLVLAGME